MKATVFVTWDDAPHLSEAAKQAQMASIRPEQRASRTKGVPSLGAGAIYQVSEEDIKIAGFPIPDFWPRCGGFDVGWNRTAALWAARNPDTGGVVVYDEYYRGLAEPSVHAVGIKARGDWVPFAIDPASRGRSQIDGQKLFDLYLGLGIDIEKADNAREAGIQAVWEMLSQGQLKVFSSCTNFFSEYRLYRRDERGMIVKKNDHLMDALRYLIMTGLSRAKVKPNPRPDGKPWFHWAPPPVWAG